MFGLALEGRGAPRTRLGAVLCLGAALALAACAERETILTGERLDLRAEAARDDRSLPIRLPAAVSRAEWTHKASDPAHDIPHAAFAANPRLVLSVPIGEGESRRQRITADPVIAGGRVFTVDAGGRVMAHSTTGAALWSRSVVPPGETEGDAVGAGLAVSGGTLYVSTAYGDLLALDAASGRERWVQDIGAAAGGAPTVAGDLVYVVGRDATAWAVRTDTGRVAWTTQGTPSPAGVAAGAAPAVSGDWVVLPFASRELAGALRAGGTRMWTTVVAGSRLGRVYASVTDITGDPVIEGGRVYAGSPTGRIDAFDLSTGERLWSAQDGAMSPVVVAGGSVFAVTDRAELVRLDAADGTRVWGTRLPYFKPARLSRRKSVYAHYGPVLAGGRLWVASDDGTLRAFAPESGALAAEIALPGGAASNPVVAGGTMWVVSSQGRLLAFR